MKLEKKKLTKPTIKHSDKIELYGYGETGGSNDAPSCDANGGIANCAC